MLQRITRSWSLDERSVSLFRIILGFSILYLLVTNKLPWAAECWGADRIIPEDVRLYVHGKLNYSVFDYVHSNVFAYVWIYTAIALSFLYAIGFRTRIVSVLLLFFMLNLWQATPFFTHGFDRYTMCFLTWSCFLPLDNHFSIRPPAVKKSVPFWASLIMLMQIMWIYFGTGIVKYGDAWTQGFAIKLMASDQWMTTPLASVFSSNEWLYRPLTYLTLILDWLFPLLLLLPFYKQWNRYVVVLYLFGFHLSVHLIADVSNFSLSGIAVSAILLPTHFWDKFNIGNTQKYEPSIYSGWQRYAVHGLAAFILYVLFIKNILFVTKNCAAAKQPYMQSVTAALRYADIPSPMSNWFFKQEWKMFAPEPSYELGWISMEYIGDDNILYDFFTHDIVAKNKHEIHFRPKGMLFHYLMPCRSMHFKARWKERAFLKFWYFYNLEKAGVPPEKWKNYFITEYKFTLLKEQELAPSEVKKVYYTEEAIRNINTTLPTQ